MTETERNAARRDYFRAYAAANKARRAAASKRWRENNRERYNEVQRLNNEKRRRLLGAEPRRQEAPKPALKVRPVVVVPRDVAGLAARFAAFRAARKEAQP